eukprot:1157351-Pelagomonas_calceolata.AAC.8
MTNWAGQQMQQLHGQVQSFVPPVQPRMQHDDHDPSSSQSTNNKGWIVKTLLLHSDYGINQSVTCTHPHLPLSTASKGVTTVPPPMPSRPESHWSMDVPVSASSMHRQYKYLAS